MTPPAKPAFPLRFPGLAAGRPGLVALLRDHSIVVLVLLLVALVIGIAAIRPGTVTADWISNTLLFAAPLGLIAGGQTLLLLTGGIDLSVASVATGSAYLLSANAAQHGAAAVFLALAVGLVVGLLNGLGVAIFRVQPLVMTLGTGLMTEGVLVVYSQKIIANLPHVPGFILALGSGKVFRFLPIDLLLWMPVATLLVLGLRHSGFGRLLYAVGDNTEACRLAGVRVWRVLLAAYVACGMLSAIAGLILVGTTNAADLSLANAYLLPSIAAAIIGGTSIFGGRGGYSGTIVGAMILTVLDSLLTLLDAPEPIKQILYGVIILLLAAAYTRLTD
jgi:ribose transport system permease protein